MIQLTVQQLSKELSHIPNLRKLCVYEGTFFRTRWNTFDVYERFCPYWELWVDMAAALVSAVPALNEIRLFPFQTNLAPSGLEPMVTLRVGRRKVSGLEERVEISIVDSGEYE